MGALTIIMHFIPRKWIKKMRYLEVYMVLEFLASFPFGFVNLMNSIHNSVFINGDIIIGAVIVIIWAHNSLGVNYLEDLFFWDMNTFSIKGIPGNYFPYLMAIPFLYWANVNLLNSDLQLHFVSTIAFLDNDRLAGAHRPRVGGYQSVSIHVLHHLPIWIITSLIFGFWAHYSCVGLLKGLRAIPSSKAKQKKD